MRQSRYDLKESEKNRHKTVSVVCCGPAVCHSQKCKYTEQGNSEALHRILNDKAHFYDQLLSIAPPLYVKKHILGYGTEMQARLLFSRQ